MDVKIPEIGESIHEALVAQWLKEDGATVARDDNLCELETDKINVEVPAETDGVLRIKVQAGETVEIGTVIATIEEGSGEPEKKAKDKESEDKESEDKESEDKESEDKESKDKESKDKESKDEESKDEESKDEESKDEESKDEESKDEEPDGKDAGKEPAAESPINPAARQLAREEQLDLSRIEGSGRNGRITLEDVQKAAREAKAGKSASAKSAEAARSQEAVKKPAAAAEDHADETGRPVTREAMTPIRQRIAARLLEARQQTAMLTTFNEADMTGVKALRTKHQEHFSKRHGIKLGLMSFFVKATVEALKQFPAVNARIDGQEIVYHHYYDIGIAVGTDRGLVVPVLRDAAHLTFAEIEQGIADLAEKAQTRKLTLADLEGGTFTISNGGIYGSLLSTPILNPPQTGVLGMHAIQDRAVVRDGEIVIRPIMNLALSYDHRLIDGREAVGFLKLIKEYIEDPEELLLEL